MDSRSLCINGEGDIAAIKMFVDQGQLLDSQAGLLPCTGIFFAMAEITTYRILSIILEGQYFLSYFMLQVLEPK